MGDDLFYEEECPSINRLEKYGYDPILLKDFDHHDSYGLKEHKKDGIYKWVDEPIIELFESDKFNYFGFFKRVRQDIIYRELTDDQ